MAYFAGTPGDDTYPGTPEDDYIHDGAGGDDILSGAGGDDFIDISAAGTASRKIVDGGLGEDFLSVDWRQVNSDLVIDVSQDGVFTDGADRRVEFRGFEHYYISAGSGDDIITGGAGDDYLAGGLGDNVLNGGGGDDYLDSPDPDSRFDGGDGEDVADLGALEMAGAVTFVLGDPSTVSHIFVDGVARGSVRGVERIVFSGGNGDDRLTGAAGADALSGGAGQNVLDGGGGDDSLSSRSSSDVLDGGAGLDYLAMGYSQTSADFEFALGDPDAVSRIFVNGVANGSITGIESVFFHGGAGDDRLTGGAGDDSLWGGGGQNVVDGGGGDDSLTSQSAADVLDGNDGVDHLSLSYHPMAADIEFSLGDPGAVSRILVNGVASGSVTGVESLTFLGGAGDDRVTGGGQDDFLSAGAGTDRLFGGGGDDALNGGAGADDMQGGLGDDTYYVDNLGDVVTELRGEGDDQVFSSVNFNAQAMGGDIENVTLTGSARTAIGNGLDNTLIGNDRNNVLNGYKGADRMEGGLGNDVYIVDNVGDVVVEFGGLGADRVNSAIDYVLGEHVENLTLLGGADLSGTGNALLNRIVGNRGDNMIAGAGGVDILTGGAGQDAFVYTSVSDSTYGGYDRIMDLDYDDTIDLRAIDANANTAEINEDFILVEAFSRTAGEMILAFNGDFTFLVGDTDGDGKGDFRIALIGDHGDFDNILG